MLIDTFMPAFHVSTRHETHVAAPADVVYETIRHLDFRHSRVVRTLFWVRNVPSSMMTMDAIAEQGMTLLGERPNREFVLGVIGRFWRMKRVDLRTTSSEEFRSYRAQGYGKAAWSFHVYPEENGTRLVTETRVYCPDDVTRKMFNFYWMFVGTASSVIRRMLLRTARREAEASVASGV